MAKITSDMLILDAVQQGNTDAIIAVFNEVGMHCLQCAYATGETVAEAALTHGIEVEDLVEKLNQAAEK